MSLYTSYMLPVKDNESLSIVPIPEQEDNYIWAICYYLSVILPIAFCLFASLPFHLLVYHFIYQSIHLLISFIIITISGSSGSNSSNTCTNNSSSNCNRNV
jgi:hypothetical protein